MDDRVVAANLVVDEVARRIADEILDLAAHELDRPCRVVSAAIDDAGDVGDNRAEALLGVTQDGLGPVSWRDVETMPVKRGPADTVDDRRGPVRDP